MLDANNLTYDCLKSVTMTKSKSGKSRKTKYGYATLNSPNDINEVDAMNGNTL